MAGPQKNSIASADQELQDNIYPQKYPRGKIAFLAFFLLMLGILFNFPLNAWIKNLFASQLAQTSSCPISYQELDLDLFPWPKATAKNLNISGQCFNLNGPGLKIDSLSLNFSRPSFYPIGLRFKLSVLAGKSKIEAFPTLSLPYNVINVSKAKIHSSFFSFLTEGKEAFEGTMEVDALIHANFSGPKSGEFQVRSDNLSVMAQNIKGLEIPQLPLKILSFKGSLLSPEKFQIHNFALGNNESPVQTQFKGDIKINPRNFNTSNLNLEGELRFTESFLEKFAIIKLMLGDANQVNGFYRLKIKGTMAAPQTSFN